MFFARFWLSGTRCLSDAITSTKLGQPVKKEGGTILGQPMLFECMGICVFSLAHECEIRGSLVYLLIVKRLPHRFCLKFSHSISVSYTHLTLPTNAEV